MTSMPARQRGALEVLLFEDTRFRGSLMFTSSEVTIGSGPGVMVPLPDAHVAPCHAVLRFDGDSCRIEDCGSALGTEVNGAPVVSQAIEGMDEISIGRYRLRITVHKPDATPAPVSVPTVSKPAGVASPKLPPPLSRPPPPKSSVSAVTLPLPPPSAAPVAAVRPPSAKAPVLPPPLPPSLATVPLPRRVGSPPAPPPGASGQTADPARPPRSSRAPALPAAHHRGKAGEPFQVSPGSKPSAMAAPLVAQSIPAPSARPSHGSAPLAYASRSASPNSAAAQGAPALATAPVLETPSPSDEEEVRVEEEEVRVSKLFAVTTPPPPARAWPDDDDDEDTVFEPTFSLLEGLSEGGVVDTSAEHAVEVIRFRHGCVMKLRHLRGGERLRLPGLRKAVGRSPRRGSFAFYRNALPERAAIREAGQPIDDALWRGRADKRGRVPLDPCTQVVFPLPSGEGILVHLVPAAAPLPRAPFRLKLTKSMAWIGGVSLLVHLVVFAIIGLTSLVRREYIVDDKAGRFARIALKEIELEPPAAPPAREKKKPKPEPSQNASSETAPKVAVMRIPRARTAPAPQASATAQKLLSALGSMSTGPKTSVATAISNLDAVGPVRGGGFKVSGAIGKLPGDSLRLAAAGSGIGRIDTKSAHDVGKDLGRVLGRAPSGQVRAQVTSNPHTMKVEGHLDRGEIQRVINSHIHELQGCYERQLIVSPNLSGKVTFEWVIGTGGGVTSVKIKTSTLSSNEATSCMQAAIRRWQFPSPSGGSVTVIYPIALATSGT
jgi:hypothetical protein